MHADTVHLTLYSIDTDFDASKNRHFFKTSWKKKKIAPNEQFFLFPTMFSTQSDNCIPICPCF